MRQLERAYGWILLLPALLPVVIWSGVIYPYLVPKTLAFYAVSLVALAVFLLLAAYGRAFSWVRLARWEAWIPIMLLALAYVASAFGVDFYRSFWSLFVRGDGLLMLTCAVADFYLILLYADRAFLDRLLRVVALVGSFVALYGIGEWLIAGGRIGSLLGNAAFFAGYLGVSLFATIIAAQSLPLAWKRAAVIGAVLQVIAIVLTATRGTILALGIALVAWLVYRSFFTAGATKRFDEDKTWPSGPERARQNVWWRRHTGGSGWARIVLAIIIIAGGLFFVFRSELAKVPFAPVARVATASAADPDIASRLFIWQNMLGEIGKHPWLGVGAEHVDSLFNSFYDPTKIAEEWFDRSHNAFLDYAAQYGIGGLLLYLALIVAFFSAAVRLARQGEKRTALAIALLALVYAVQNFFVFDTVSSFWLFLALLAAFLALASGENARTPLSAGISARVAAWIAAVILVALIIPVSAYPTAAAYDLAQAYHYQITDVPSEIQYLSRGLALGTYGGLEYGYEAYDMYVSNQRSALSGQALMNAYQAALAVLTQSFNRFPYDARTALYLAHVLSLAPSGAPADKVLLSSALERAIRLSPKRSQPWYILANLSISQANLSPVGSAERATGYMAAADLLHRYLALVPTLSEPHFVLAELLLASGDTTGAASEAAIGKSDYRSDLETASRAATYYENALNLSDAAFFLGEVVRLDPTNTAAASDLAKIQAYERSKH